MLNFIIIGWATPETAAILTYEDGIPHVFHNKKEALDYAKLNCAWSWKVLELI